MSSDPQRRSRKRPAPVESERPKIWAEGGQRARFSMRGLRQATLHLSREAVAPLNAWAARALRRLRSLTPFHTTSRRFLQPVSGLSGFTPR